MPDDPVFTSHVVHERLEKEELSGQVQNAIDGRFHVLLDKTHRLLGNRVSRERRDDHGVGGSSEHSIHHDIRSGAGMEMVSLT